MSTRGQQRSWKLERSASIRRRYSLVLVASVPPPIAGQSIATEILLRAIRAAEINHRVVNLSRDFDTSNSVGKRVRRLLTVAQLPARVAMAGRALPNRPRILYLQLGQSIEAMARDIPILALAKALGWPAVVHVHGGGFRNAFARAPLAIQAVLRPLLAGVARAITLSSSLEVMFEGLVPSGLIVSIPNGTPSEVSDRARKMERIAPHDPPVVLYLGNLIESKGYGIVLEAARLAAQRRLRYRFVIAGALAEKTTLTPADYIARHRLENTSFLGPVYGQRKLDLLASADIFVLPTAYPIEGQPIAILEAMQFGLPIISTRQGGIPDIVVDGVNGLLIDPEDPTELLVAVDDLSKHRRWAEVAERNRAEALERYDARLHGVRMLEVFDDVAGAMLRTPPLF